MRKVVEINLKSPMGMRSGLFKSSSRDYLPFWSVMAYLPVLLSFILRRTLIFQQIIKVHEKRKRRFWAYPHFYVKNKGKRKEVTLRETESDDSEQKMRVFNKKRKETSFTGGASMSYRKWLVHAIANCQECDWEELDYKTAQKLARKHHLKTGHEVHIETGYAGTYK